jgi:hypothetical protein
MKKDITALFCLVDDFYKSLKQEIEKHQISDGEKSRKPTRIPGLIENEIMTIILMFQESPCRNFKYFYKSISPTYSCTNQNFPACLPTKDLSL